MRMHRMENLKMNIYCLLQDSSPSLILIVSVLDAAAVTNFSVLLTDTAKPVYINIFLNKTLE
jgi:hypothetical protein